MQKVDGAVQSIRAVAGPDAVLVVSSIPLQGKDLRTLADFKVKSGETFSFTLTWFRSYEPPPDPVLNPLIAIRKTIYWWKEWSDRSQYVGPDLSGVKRSLITLKALTYAPTGGIIAAPTTSLPEAPGGTRNWDYRFCWIRDSTFH